MHPILETLICRVYENKLPARVAATQAAAKWKDGIRYSLSSKSDSVNQANKQKVNVYENFLIIQSTQ